MIKRTAQPKKPVCLLLATSLVVAIGCAGPGNALRLQDYGRDLLSTAGALAVALLLDGPASTPAPSLAPGLACWDLNGNYTADPDEDVNGDGTFDILDCAGPNGVPGEAGASAPGEPGVPGTVCWDLNGNGFNDPEEDVNADGVFSSLDCVGPDGEDGERGSTGPQGPAGADGESYSEYFTMFVDDFFTNIEPETGMPVQVAKIIEPALPIDSVVAFRMAVPEIYDANVAPQISMRMFFYRVGPEPDGCFVFQLDAARLQNGGGIEAYGSSRWIRVNSAGTTYDDGILLVVDIPINAPAGGLGLDYPNNMDSGHFLAFELNATNYDDGGDYILLGVEFYADAAGSTPVYPASAVSESLEAAAAGCGGPEPEPGPDVCPDVQIFVSSFNNRAEANYLDGRLVSGDIHVFTLPEAGVKSITFYIDGAQYRYEKRAPHDMNGTDDQTELALPFDTTTLANGTHEVHVEVVSASTQTLCTEVHATFVVDNSEPQ